MLEYRLDIEDKSTWILTTQPAPAMELPFVMSEIGLFYAGPGYYTKRSGRAGYYLVYTEAGLGKMHTENGACELSPGSALLLPCGPMHHYHTQGSGWTHYWMHLEGAGVPPYAQLLQTSVVLSQAQRFEREFSALISLAANLDVTAAARISHGISGLLTDLLSDSFAGERAKSTGHPGIEQALRFIQENYQNPIAIEDITRTINISKFHFVRQFRRQVGTTPYNYLLQYRVNQSKRLLCVTDDPVAEIAQRVGYQSTSNYISQFSRITGMTPKQFRKSNLNYLEASGRE